MPVREGTYDTYHNFQERAIIANDGGTRAGWTAGTRRVAVRCVED